MQITTERYQEAAQEIEKTIRRVQAITPETAQERRERRLAAIAHLEEARIERIKDQDPRQTIHKAFAETINEDSYQMGRSRTCPDKEISQMWAAMTGESFTISAAHFFMGKIAAYRAEPAFYQESDIKPYRREAYNYMVDAGVRESWHLAYYLGITPEDYQTATGESFEQTRAKHYFWKVARRHAKGETIIWSETNGAMKNGQSKDMDLMEALINAAAAGVKTEADLPKILGVTGREWKRRTGHAFIPMQGEKKRVGQLRQKSGKTEAFHSFSLQQPLSYAPACTHG